MHVTADKNDWAVIALKMEAAFTSETSVNFYQTTWCKIPDDIHLNAYSVRRKWRQ
jgi:hypothetical protein